MESADLVARLADIEARLARLEPRPSRSAATDIGLAQQLLADLDPDGAGARVVYAGAGPWAGGAVAWQLSRSWEEVAAEAPEPLARVLSALASPVRVRIVTALLAGPRGTSELAEALDQPSAGQLFHHLKELLAAGVIHQPERGRYAVRKQHDVPLLAVISAAADVAPPAVGEPAE